MGKLSGRRSGHRGESWPKIRKDALHSPERHLLMSNINPTHEEQALHILRSQRKPHIERHSHTDDFRR